MSNKDIPKIMDPLKIIICAQKLFYPIITSKAICTSPLTLQKALDLALKVEWEYLLVEVIHHTDQDAVMSIDVQGLTSQDPMK